MNTGLKITFAPTKSTTRDGFNSMLKINSYVHTLTLIKKQLRDKDIPYVTRVSYEKNPFKILVSCILSLRTKDEVTAKASKSLFRAVRRPKDLLKYSQKEIEKLIYPVGFYRNKAKVLKDLGYRLVYHYKGKVPNKEETLLSFRGVGRKTANLVLGLGFGVPAICVDTHVHRISNRLGWVKTINPYDTEESLKRIIPRCYWIELNTILVAFGKAVCTPISPSCSRCRVNKYCKKRGVKRSR